MYKNVQYWMRLYVARVIKGGLMAVVASFLLFECSDDSLKMGNVILSKSTLVFDDTAGSTGGEYEISLSQDPAADKTVQVTLTSDNNDLNISPTVVTFTETTGNAPQTIIVKRTDDASAELVEDLTGLINHTIASDADNDPNITTFHDGSTVNVTVNSTFVADSDGNGLIEIGDATMLNNMRYDLAGTSYKTSDDDDGDSSGCPDSGCNGYELIDDIDLLSLLDTNNNGEIDTISKSVLMDVDGVTDDVIDVSVDTSWVPIGNTDGGEFRGIFEGNHHTIENLWVNGTSSNTGLFGSTDDAIIRNVGVISGSVHSFQSFSGGLVGVSSGSLMIVNSYLSDNFGGISNFAGGLSGGLIGNTGRGDANEPLMIVNSYFSGGKVASIQMAGGLVGNSHLSLTIVNSYFSGDDIYGGFYAGGLVGQSKGKSSGAAAPVMPASLIIKNSYFGGSGDIASGSRSGGLVGNLNSSSSTITNSYWNTEASQIKRGRVQSPPRERGNAAGLGNGLTLSQLRAIDSTGPSGLGDAWDLGTTSQLPAIKRCVGLITAGVCASYGDLLGRQKDR